jgi:Na+-transporting NADH:ubiquinone oxidoreductase subunit A
MISIKVKKGYDLKIAGKPSQEVEERSAPTKVAYLPEKIPYIKPRLQVRVGDEVKLGSVLFEDKRNTDVKFRSPGGGKVADIQFGPRRVIQQIVIELDENEQAETFPAVSEADLAGMEREKLVEMIMNGGLWPILRELPFRDYAAPEYTPPIIIVGLNNLDPFNPEPDIYLQGKQELLKYGIKVLEKLAKKVSITAGGKVSSEIQNQLTHHVSGAFPADDPGVLLYHTKTSPAENRSWFISGQDLLLLADLLKNGQYPTERTVVVGGSLVQRGKHIRTRLGAPLTYLTDGLGVEANARYVAGGLFRGSEIRKDAFMGLFETALTVLPEGDTEEFLGFARPGFKKPSHSKTFFSFFNRKPLESSCNRGGGLRACVNCGYCAEVCPVDILPQYTLRSIVADEVEESLQLGLLDCVECGLCTYVCPSKIELKSILKEAKDAYYKEQG